MEFLVFEQNALVVTPAGVGLCEALLSLILGMHDERHGRDLIARATLRGEEIRSGKMGI